MFELGPILRSLRRHKGPVVLFVVEVAVGMVVLTHLFVMGGNYRSIASAYSGVEEADLVFVTRRFAERRQSQRVSRARALADRAALTGIDGVTAAIIVDELPLPEIEAFPAIVRTTPEAGAADLGGASPAASGAIPTVAAAPAWPLRATADVVKVLGLVCIAGGCAPFDAKVGPASGGALVTATLARSLFPGGDAVGRSIDTEGFGRARVVGVVDDFRVRMPFLPDSKAVVVLADVPVTESRLVYIVRTKAGLHDGLSREISTRLSTGPLATAGDVVEVPRFNHRAMRFHRIARGATIVIVWTALVVLGVTLFGSLALSSFSVAERTRQIGVRRALGARRGHIVRYFLIENALVTSIGLALGLTMTLAANIAVRAMSPPMAMTWRHIVIAMIIFWIAGLLSALVPARRAARVPPTAATRSL